MLTLLGQPTMEMAPVLDCNVAHQHVVVSLWAVGMWGWVVDQMVRGSPALLAY